MKKVRKLTDEQFFAILRESGGIYARTARVFEAESVVTLDPGPARSEDRLARWHEENDSRLEAEREAHFQAYLKSLNLDTTIEIPCTIIHNDGKTEDSSYKITES
jgi:hypothetical protein